MTCGLARQCLPLKRLVLAAFLTGDALLTVAVALWPGRYYAAPFLLLWAARHDGGGGHRAGWQRQPCRRMRKRPPGRCGGANSAVKDCPLT